MEDLTPVYRIAIAHIDRGDWEGAHLIVQDLETPEAAAIHAYLHRVEGDESNARYWYRRARVDPVSGSLAEELEALKKKLGEK